LAPSQLSKRTDEELEEERKNRYKPLHKKFAVEKLEEE
jgi:hypothetical protein